MQKLVSLEHRVFGLDLGVVHVDAALLDRASRLAEALHEPRVDQQLRDRGAGSAACAGQLVECGFEGRRVERREVALTEQRLGGEDRRVYCGRAMHERRHLESEALLSRPTEWLFCHQTLVLLDLGAGQEGKHLQPVDHVGVGLVEPELVEAVRRAHLGVEPDGVALALSELGAIRVRDERGADGVRRLPFDLANEVGAARQVAPLVAATRLQLAVVLTKELEKVEALQNLVAELGVADALIGVQSRRNRVFLEHRADAEVLADLAQEVDRAQRGGPVEVVDEAHRVLALVREKARHLRLQACHPLFNGLAAVQGALGGRARITDQTGRATDEAEGLVPLQLEPTQKQQLHKVAEVQAGSGRVEAAVIGERSALEQLAERLGVGRYVHQPAPLELVPKGREAVVIALGRHDLGSFISYRHVFNRIPCRRHQTP